MNKLVACLFAGVVLGTALPALGQQAPAVDPAGVTRIVIAPPTSDIARIIQAELSAAYYGATAGSKAYQEAQRLYFFYGSRHFEPLWLVEGDNGTVAFSAKAGKIVEAFKGASAEGLRPEDYITPDLDLSAIAADPKGLAAVETAFSAAALRYAQHLFNGRIIPSTVSDDFDIPQRRIDEAKVMADLVASDDPAAVFAALDPKHPEFLALKAALARYEAGEASQTVAIPEGPVLKPGMTDERVLLLRARLSVTTLPAEGAEKVYDDGVVEAVKAFQASLGLTTDGIMGPATVAALNGGSAVTKADILANMERWRWMPRDLGDFNVFVNIPEFRLYVMEHGQQAYTTRVVVGATNHQTVIFSDTIRHIVVNPYWNVPPSIIRNEIIPHLAANPGYIAGQNMELLYNGKVVSASQVNWSVVGAGNFPFSVRQKPGDGNALGRVKFLFPNSHDIYLHDTPSKSLFGRDFRALSHGCIRVQNPMEFADALLKYEPAVTAAKLEAMYGPSERWVNLEHRIPVHLAYFTLRVAPDGTIRSFGDVYGLNKALIAKMAE